MKSRNPIDRRGERLQVALKSGLQDPVWVRVAIS